LRLEFGIVCTARSRSVDSVPAGNRRPSRLRCITRGHHRVIEHPVDLVRLVQMRLVCGESRSTCDSSGQVRDSDSE
jgi:hypothetical protein